MFSRLGNTAESILTDAIQRTARRLAVPGSVRRTPPQLLPDACPVVPARLATHRIRDPLSVLAVITQSTDTAWLRTSEPDLTRLDVLRELALRISPSDLPALPPRRCPGPSKFVIL